MEEGCQEEAQKKQVEKKRKKRRMEQEESGMKSLEKWFQASRRRQARMKMPSRQHKEQLGKVSSKAGDCSQVDEEEE